MAEDCKTSIHRFDSGRRLPQNPAENDESGPKTAPVEPGEDHGKSRQNSVGHDRFAQPLPTGSRASWPVTRLADLRLVLDRADRVRVHVDGRELMRAESPAAALRFIADRLERLDVREQLSALATALVPPEAPTA